MKEDTVADGESKRVLSMDKFEFDTSMFICLAKSSKSGESCLVFFSGVFVLNFRLCFKGDLVGEVSSNAWRYFEATFRVAIGITLGKKGDRLERRLVSGTEKSVIRLCI